jgi:hypothetical protein
MLQAADIHHLSFTFEPCTFAFVKLPLHLLLTAFMAMNFAWGHDWMHMPDLLQHYAEHRAEHSDLGFFEFLGLHYADAEHHDSDGSHENLPFNHDHKEHIGVDHVYWSPVLSAHHLFLPIEGASVLLNADMPLDGFRRARLQPPRYA